jgi:hypothetical protein
MKESIGKERNRVQTITITYHHNQYVQFVQEHYINVLTLE